jgi:GMP synthase (glutamine-hydrolysing)
MILIVDNRSSYIKRFRKRRLLPAGIPHRVVRHDRPLPDEAYDETKGLILSGGKGTPWGPLVLTADFQALMNLDVPVLAFCLGHEIVAVAHGGRIGRMTLQRERSDVLTILEPDDPIFSGIEGDEIRIRMKHHHHVVGQPPMFKRLASSSPCPLEILRHVEKPVYTFQGHPEVSGEVGWLLIRNWLAMCGYGIGP